MTSVKIKDLSGATIDEIDVGGFLIPDFKKPPAEAKQLFDSIPHFEFRDDDLMLCTYPKTGTNWMYEIIMMIINKSAKPVESNKGIIMLEFQSRDIIEKQPSPRVMNCHFPCRYLPLNDMKAKQIKTVLCCRNPKDTAVSYYNHMKGIEVYGYDGKWSDWLPVYLQGKLEYGKYTDYLLEWEKAMKEGVGYPLHVMYYEDMKLNGLEEIDRLLKFLDVDLSEELKKDIIHMCGFENMANKTMPNDMEKVFFKQDFKFFRKGRVGDWKNWFTVAQNENFDEIWENEMNGSTFSQFKYSDQRDGNDVSQPSF